MAVLERVIMAGLSVEESADERTQTQSVAFKDEKQKVNEDDCVDFHDL